MVYDSIPVDQPAPSKVPEYILPMQYAPAVMRFCEMYDVPIWMACRLITYESRWDPTFASAKRRDGSRDEGLGALNSKYWKEFEEKYSSNKDQNAFNPEINIEISIKLLAHLYKELGAWDAALGAWNCGLTGWKSGRIPTITRSFIRAVMGGK